MLGVCRVAGPMLAYLVLLLFPVGLAGQEVQVTLYTPDGSQQRTLSTPMVVDVGLPSPMETPASAVTGTGTGTRRTDVEVVVSEGAGGQVTTSYADGRISSLAADASGHVWAGTSAGLSRFDGQQWTTFTQADGLVDGVIHSLAVDGQDQVWAGIRFREGLLRFDGQRWTRYQFEGLWDSVVSIAPNGDVWCTGYGDVLLARFDGQDWWTYDHDDIGIDNESVYIPLDDNVWASEDFYISEIAFDRSGTLWVVAEFFKGTAGVRSSTEVMVHRLLSFNGTEWTLYELDTRQILMIFSDSQGRVWMSCGDLCVKDGSTWKRYDMVGTADHTRWTVVDGMTEDAAGRLWIADDYFGVLEGTTWTGFYWEELSADFVSPVIDSRGDLWIPSWDGLYRWHHSDLPTAIESSSISAEPRSFHLEQNYPNPFNHATHISFTLQQPSAVSLKVFNTHGQLVATLVEDLRPAGTYQVAWDGRDDRGQAVSSGAYIVRLDAAGQQATRKMLLIQ
ncbi:MAG: T9SS type A sorting domain-containing protein [Gemmatimonadetes bacterium]|nr:T9SS type A sorting domain-containing protein [Gemmatimonadota bacterium]